MLFTLGAPLGAVWRLVTRMDSLVRLMDTSGSIEREVYTKAVKVYTSPGPVNVGSKMAKVGPRTPTCAQLEAK